MLSKICNAAAFLLCLAFTASLDAAAPETSKRLELYHGLARGNYLAGDLRGAERGIEQTLRLDPDHAPALTLKAQILLDKGNPEAALAVLETLLEAQPDNMSLLNRKAIALGRLGKRTQALALLERIVAESKNQSEAGRMAYRLTGLLRMAGEEWDAAAEAFRQADADTPANATNLRLAGEAYLEKANRALRDRQVDEAIAAIDQAIEIYEDETGDDAFEHINRLRTLRARAYARSGNFDAAIRDLRTVLARQPHDLATRITLASLYAAADRYEALRGLLDPLEGKPALADIYHYFEGRLAFAEDRLGTARRHFEAALQEAPDNNSALHANLHFYRALCLQRLGRPDEAKPALTAAIQNNFRPETLEEATAAARMLMRSNRAKDAIPILEAVTLNRIDGSPAAWALLGRAHQSEGDTALALSAFNESLAGDPAQPGTLALRGSLLRSIGDLEGAAADFENALVLSPQEGAIHYALGLTYLRGGSIGRAANSLRRAAKIQPDNASIQLLHALLAFATRQYDTARAAILDYESLVAGNPNPTVHYLNYLLGRSMPEPSEQSETFMRFVDYCSGKLGRKAVIDHAGLAVSEELARKQICAAAFWMAQHERLTDSSAAAKELLELCVDLDLPESTKFQLARWQLNQTARP